MTELNKGLHCNSIPLRHEACRKVTARERRRSLEALPPGIDQLPWTGYIRNAGWSSPVARWAHNPKVVGSNPTPATNQISITKV